jgi:hypothetical protein
MSLKSKLDEIYQDPDRYENEDPYFLVDVYLKKYVIAIQDILIEEDDLLAGQIGSVGDCMEFTIRNNIPMEMVALAQSNNPNGMFTVCLDFII